MKRVEQRVYHPRRILREARDVAARHEGPAGPGEHDAAQARTRYGATDRIAEGDGPSERRERSRPPSG
jgi:hypothetical protein